MTRFSHDLCKNIIEAIIILLFFTTLFLEGGTELPDVVVGVCRRVVDEL